MTEGGAGVAEGGAGMTGVGHWCRVAGVTHIAGFLSAAQHARRAAAALTRSGGGA